MGLFDKILDAPGEAAKAAGKATGRLPLVPVEMAEKFIDGVEKGIDEGTKKIENKDA